MRLWPNLTLGLLAVCALGIAGCSGTREPALSNGVDKVPVDESGPWTYRDPTEKELLLARSDFSVEIVRFTDSRRPRSMEALSRDQLIYQYDPDTLVGGVSYGVPGVLGKYLSYRPKTPKHYKVEIELKELVTVIKTGTFWSGSWGRYAVETEMVVTARRPDSTVVLRKTYRLDDEQKREDYNGRGPSKERDRARMFDLTQALMRKAAEEIGWDIRQRDARRWNPVAPQSIPTRLNLPPVDRASGTPESQLAPLMPVAPALPVDDAVSDGAPTITPVEAPLPSGWIEDTRPDSGEVPAFEEPVEGDMGPVI